MEIPRHVFRNIVTSEIATGAIGERGARMAADDVMLFAEFPIYRTRHERQALPDGNTPTVFVVADDEDGRRSLEQLMATAGFDVEGCGSAEQVLSLFRPAVPCCLVLLDVSPAANGLELQQQVRAAMEMPIVFITNHPDVRVTVQAMKAGAVDVLAEPVNAEQLLSAVAAAIELSRAALRRDADMRRLRDCYAALTPREREVMALVVTGLLNKQVGFELGISEITVKAHRGQVMRKMKADSLPQLVRMAARLDAAWAPALRAGEPLDTSSPNPSVSPEAHGTGRRYEGVVDTFVQ